MIHRMSSCFRNSVLVVTVLVVALCMFTERARAETVFLKSSSTRYSVGQSFIVNLICDTSGNVINTISGSVHIPSDMFEVSDIRYGNSVVSLWVDKPRYDEKQGVLYFSGGVPGGFSSSDAPIVSFVMHAKKAGRARIGLPDFSLLLNDGSGTEVEKVTLPSYDVRVTESTGGSQESFVAQKDNLPPEDFEVVVSTDRTVSDGKYFVSFFAVDKDSGIDHYEIMEAPFLMPFLRSGWVLSDSPYVLRNQLWITKVTVRAYDGAGNYKDSCVTSPIGGVVYGILFVVVVVCLYRVSKSFRHKKKNR